MSSLSIKSHFRKLRDPRRRHCRDHRFLDIIVIAICAVIGNADSWRAIALWGRTHETWLRRFLALPHGIPCHDTFRRLFQRLDSTVLQTCLRQWLLALTGVLKVSHIAIDGKTCLRVQGANAHIAAIFDEQRRKLAAVAILIDTEAALAELNGG